MSVRIVSYVQVSANCWRVYWPTSEGLVHIGFAYKGLNTARFSKLDGRGRLFNSMAELESRVERAAAVMMAKRMERAGIKGAA